MYKTEGLTKNEEVSIERAPGASDADAIHAFATDLLRRAKAGELVYLRADARDVNGNLLKYRLGKAQPSTLA